LGGVHDEKTEPAIEKIDFSHEQTSDFRCLSLRLSRASAGSISILNIIINRSLIRLRSQLACDLLPRIAVSLDNELRSGERWLDGKRNEKSAMRETGYPAGVSQRCNWSITAQFTIVAIEPALPSTLVKIG